MTDGPKFKQAFPYQKDVLALPVKDIAAASAWYCEHFGMAEIERAAEPVATVILERDGTRIGFAENGGDPSQDGAAILGADINSLKSEFEGKGVNVGNVRIDARDGKRFQVFFVVAPDGLCYYIHEPVAGE
jgi:catechol 2,3-dioxygenase-like lactoylglutathione lyase family enzyme